ncbi:MAG: AMP-binding protein [bacterium]|nr:AMP-binding protein [bacterium]
MSSTISTVAEGVDTLFSAFEKAANRWPDNVALKADGGRSTSFTYREALDLVRRLAAGLQAEQYSKISEVGLLAENRPEWCLIYLAIVAAGKTVVPIDANLKPNEQAAIIKLADLRLVFSSARFEPTLTELDRDMEIVSLESDADTSWKSLLAESDKVEPRANIDTVAALIYTSGTTGAPKAVMLTHKNLLGDLKGIDLALDFRPSDVMLSVLPLHHTFEATCGFLMPLTSGLTVVYARSLKSRDICEDLAYNQATIMCGVPLLYEKIHQAIQRGIAAAPAHRRILLRVLFGLSALGWKLGMKWGRGLFTHLRQKAGLDSIRMFVSGGAPLPASISRFFNLIGFDLLQGYGMTETSPVVSANRPDDIEFGSSGPPLPGVEVRIDQPNAEGIGEILVRGDVCTPGYKDNPDQTAELIIDGWLHTGDLGHLRRGHVWITGRAKNLIISAAGKNIYPEELEEKLVESRFVLEAVVAGRKKEGRQGEEVRAIIVPDLEQFIAERGLSAVNPDMEKITSTLKEEVAHINQQVSDYKRVSDFDVQLNELEKTSTKKIKRSIYSY